MGIVEFLEARIAEDEREAEAGALREFYFHGDEGWRRRRDRFIAECESKRAILRRHATITVWPDGTGGAKYYTGSKQVCASCDERTQSPCPTIRLLATVYKDHPDYQQEWAL